MKAHFRQRLFDEMKRVGLLVEVDQGDEPPETIHVEPSLLSWLAVSRVVCLARLAGLPEANVHRLRNKLVRAKMGLKMDAEAAEAADGEGEPLVTRAKMEWPSETFTAYQNLIRSVGLLAADVEDLMRAQIDQNCDTDDLRRSRNFEVRQEAIYFLAYLVNGWYLAQFDIDLQDMLTSIVPAETVEALLREALSDKCRPPIVEEFFEGLRVFLTARISDYSDSERVELEGREHPGPDAFALFLETLSEAARGDSREVSPSDPVDHIEALAVVSQMILDSGIAESAQAVALQIQHRGLDGFKTDSESGLGEK